MLRMPLNPRLKDIPLHQKHVPPLNAANRSSLATHERQWHIRSPASPEFFEERHKAVGGSGSKTVTPFSKFQVPDFLQTFNQKPMANCS